MSQYHSVKGYKAPLKHIPFEYQEEVVKQLGKNYPTLLLTDPDKIILEVDIYVSVDLRNAYKK